MWARPMQTNCSNQPHKESFQKGESRSSKWVLFAAWKTNSTKLTPKQSKFLNETQYVAYDPSELLVNIYYRWIISHFLSYVVPCINFNEGMQNYSKPLQPTSYESPPFIRIFSGQCSLCTTIYVSFVYHNN